MVETASTTGPALEQLPTADVPATLTSNQPVNNPFFQRNSGVTLPAPAPQSTATAGTSPTPPGWTSSSTVAAMPNPQPAQTTDQTWPASTTARAPFRLWSGDAGTANDGVTAYGNPNGIVPPTTVDAGRDVRQQPDGVSARYASVGGTQLATDQVANETAATGPFFQPPSLYRPPSVTRLPNLSDHGPTPGIETSISAGGQDTALPLANTGVPAIPPDARPKQVGSRTFALEYELHEVGPAGVSTVELWGTRDGGQTWQSFGRDDDNRSPLVITVDEEGLYGFRIVLDSSDGTATAPPAAGDEPELWVAVDLGRPVAELTSVEAGTGNLADHLILRWRAADDNLEPRPISLFYRSRPAGPWSAIASSLENTGQYAWRVERHVPARFYLRLEARDSAGNLAAFETREPIEFTAPAPTARLNAVEPVDPAAANGAGAASYR
jgi:hypothetical protein